jgi:hypothetical protein
MCISKKLSQVLEESGIRWIIRPAVHLLKKQHIVFSVATGSLLLVGLFLLLNGTSQVARADPGDLFVTHGGSGDCSQATPCDLQTALGSVSDGNTIYVAADTCTGAGGAVVTVTKSITLYGGWDGTTTTPPVRDPDAHPTTLDGEGVRRVVYISESISPTLDVDTEAFILWAWQHRHELNLDIDTDIPERPRSVVRAVWDTLGLFHRSSSLAESVGCKASAHSWLRPYLQIHRGMPQWLLPLLQLFWNHHTFERGKRAGSSPLELAGVEDAPSLAKVLDRLFCPSVAAQAA